MFSLMFTLIFKLISIVVCSDHILFREIVFKLFKWELSSQLYLTILDLKIHCMHQKSCKNALFTKIVMWKSLMHSQVSYVLRIIGKDAELCCPINDKRVEKICASSRFKRAFPAFFLVLSKFHKFCDTIWP